jgi:seryl-tRNA(Sec) selenium transferase
VKRLQSSSQGASRRAFFRKSGGVAAAMSAISATALEADAHSLEIGAYTYESIGVRPLINCKGTFTIITGSQTLPEVKKAMDEASRSYVQLDELMDGVGKRLASITGAEWGIVTAGCAAGITNVTAACIAGTDPERMQRLPELAGLKNNVIIPKKSRNVYDHAVRMLNVDIIEPSTKEEFESAFSGQTAMVYIMAGPEDEGPMGIESLCSIAKAKNVPVFVDAAAEVLTIPNVHLKRGATVVGYSGGKCLRGPQCAGLMLGDKNLLQAAWANSAPHHAFGRSLKVGKEEIMGMLTAVEMWTKRDHKAEWAQWEAWLGTIGNRVKTIDGITVEVRSPDDGLSNRSPNLLIQWDGSRLGITGEEVLKVVLDSEPRIILAGGRGSRPDNMKSSVTIVPYMMMPGNDKVVADRLCDVLSKPPKFENPVVSDGVPAVVAGIWEAELQFLRGTAKHRIVFEQNGKGLVGTHHGEVLYGNLKGSIHENQIQFTTVHPYEGTELHYSFGGNVDGDTMHGEVNLGEYGTAQWKAKRHQYVQSA